MKKITILAMLLMAGYAGHSQYSFEAVDDFARLEYMTYDGEVQNKVYAVTLGNHIVVSYDNGETWDLQYTFPNTVANISNLRILPGNENLVFSVHNIPADQDDLYILNIEDNEILSSFSIPESGISEPNIRSFDIYDSEASTIIMNLSGTKVFYTTTGGESWSLIYDYDNYNQVAVETVAISPNNPSKLFLTRGGSPSPVEGGIFISTDAGETWTERLPGVILDPIDFSPANADEILVGMGMMDYDTPENLYRSTDGGTTWTIVPITWTDFVLDHMNVVKYHPTDPNVIYILEENEIAYSEDGGLTWTNTVYEESEYYAGLSISINPFDTKEALITTNHNPKRTDDGGVTLGLVHAPFYNVNSLSVSKFGTTEHLYYSAQGGHLHKNYATNMTGAYNIQPPSTWNPTQHIIIPDSFTEGRVYIYAGGGMMGGTLYVSNDHGATRTPIMNGVPALMDAAVDPDNHNILYAVLDEWGMSTVQKLNLTDLENVVPEVIATPGDDAAIAGLLVYANKMVLTKNGKVYTSVDEGANWTETYALPEGTSIADLSANPLDDNAFAIATSNGVYSTEDNGATWTLSHEGIDTRKVEFSDVTDGIMAVGVYNSEGTSNAYISYFNGSEWLMVSSEEMNYIQSYEMGFNFIGENINAYIGTFDMGIIRYSFPIGTAGVIDPVSEKTAVFAAPNPASGIVTIHTTGNSAIKSVEVYNIAGQKVAQSAQPSLNVSHLSRGIYVVKAETVSGAVTSVKLVKE